MREWRGHRRENSHFLKSQKFGVIFLDNDEQVVAFDQGII
jgi:hypothetical protein